MTFARQLLLLTVCAIAATAVAGAIAMALIPQLSLNAVIRGGTIAIMAMIGSRIGMHLAARKKSRGLTR